MIGLTSMLPKFAQGIFAATRIASFESRAFIKRSYCASFMKIKHIYFKVDTSKAFWNR